MARMWSTKRSPTNSGAASEQTRSARWKSRSSLSFTWISYFSMSPYTTLTPSIYIKITIISIRVLHFPFEASRQRPQTLVPLLTRPSQLWSVTSHRVPRPHLWPASQVATDCTSGRSLLVWRPHDFDKLTIISSLVICMGSYNLGLFHVGVVDVAVHPLSSGAPQGGLACGRRWGEGSLKQSQHSLYILMAPVILL